MNFREQAQHQLDYVIGLRRHFHANPELAYQEFATTDRIAGELSSMGIPFTRLTPTGLVGEITGARPGRTLLIRAEIDDFFRRCLIVFFARHGERNEGKAYGEKDQFSMGFGNIAHTNTSFRTIARYVVCSMSSMALSISDESFLIALRSLPCAAASFAFVMSELAWEATELGKETFWTSILSDEIRDFKCAISLRISTSSDSLFI